MCHMTDDEMQVNTDSSTDVPTNGPANDKQGDTDKKEVSDIVLEVEQLGKTESTASNENKATETKEIKPIDKEEKNKKNDEDRWPR